MYGIQFEKEVYLAAIATIDAHGKRACGEAARRAGELHSAGDELGNWKWHQVTEAILEFERPLRHDGEFFN